MDVVGLAFALFGHLLASLLYIWRRIPFSSSTDAVDSSPIAENKDQLRQLWETRTMADEQTQNTQESLTSKPEGGEANEKHESKKTTVIHNGVPNGSVFAEGSEKGDPVTHDISATDCTSIDHNHTDPATTTEAAASLINVTEPSVQTDQTDPVDLLKCDHSEEKSGQEDVAKEENISEKSQDTPCGTPLDDGNNNNCLSDDQKADKIGEQNKSEVTSPSEDEINKPEEPRETAEHETETRTEELSDFRATQVADDHEERMTEPDTETYYTSNFTFVCQKPDEEDGEEEEEVEDEEEQKSEEPEPASEKVQVLEILEVNISEESLEKNDVQLIEGYMCDNSHEDAASVSGIKELPVSLSSDTPPQEYSESSADPVENVIEADCGSQPCYEHAMMTSDFQDANDDETGNISESLSANEKNENESEMYADAYSKLNSTADDEKDLPNRTESATPDSDADLKADKNIERPTHFVRLKKTGVQKTERPYDSGTTESKIAMEIREMREREEELRLMRERMQSPEGNMSPSSSPMLSPTSTSKPSQGSSESGPGYRVSTVFGHKSSSMQSPVEEEKKVYRSFSKESPVEKEIRIAKNREEELRKEKGLPPREDDSYIKPSQVKSAQVRVFGKTNATNNSKELATTKIQQEIEEQTLREMALREKGHIQTISQERTDSKVAKLKDLDVSLPECTSPTSPNGHGSFSDRGSKRSTPSPTGSSHGSIPPVSPRPVLSSQGGKGISMQKFIASKGKETTFIASRNGPSHPEQSADASRSNPVMRKAKRTVSVESKIQQEILEMKRREEELRRMHNASTDQPFLTEGENGTDPAANDVSDYINGQEINGNDELGPSSNNLIAQWEQRIQKAEGRA